MPSSTSMGSLDQPPFDALKPTNPPKHSESISDAKALDSGFGTQKEKVSSVDVDDKLSDQLQASGLSSRTSVEEVSSQH